VPGFDPFVHPGGVSPNNGAGQRAEQALLADHSRSNSEIARELGTNANTVMAARLRLAAAGLVPPVPDPPMLRAERELRAGPARSDALIAEAAGVNYTTVARVRHRLEAAGEIQPATQRARRPAPMRNAALRPQARDRAAKWLRANPARTDKLLGRLARCSPGTVQHVRHDLETAGEIEPVPVHLRASKPPEPPWTPQPRSAGAGPPRPDLSDGFCAKMGTSWWSSPSREHRELALHLCELCPVLETCRDWALKLPDAGTAIYGGMTAKMRQAIRRAVRKQERLAS
jgi:hypothetical protein